MHIKTAAYVGWTARVASYPRVIDQNLHTNGFLGEFFIKRTFYLFFDDILVFFGWKKLSQ
jgi:hypothetical protein